NTSTVDIQSGTLSLVGGGSHTGDFSGAAGTTLSFGGGHTFAATSDITGAPNVSFNSPITHNGTINTSGTLTINNGTSTFNGSLAPGSLSLTSGTAVVHGSMNAGGVTIAGGSTLNMQVNGTTGTLNVVNGTISGPGKLTVTGLVQFTGATTLSGTA